MSGAPHGGSALAAVEAALSALGDDPCHAFLEVDHDGARRRATALDAGPALPLRGHVLAVKDNLAVAGLRCTAGSRLLADYVPGHTATAVERLVAQGAVILGKTNLDEFGMGSSTEASAFGPTLNPRALDRIPGGSSGGSAAAVAAGVCRLALGSDTGGSIRQPAAYCGVVGLKPTWGAVSRFGLVAYASSLDTVGPMAPTVAEAMAAFRAMRGPDPRDATARERPLGSGPSAPASIKGLRVGVAEGWAAAAGLHPGVREAVARAADRLASAGADVRAVALPEPDAALAAYYVLAPAEASSNLARYDGVRYGARVPAPDLLGMYERTRSAGFGPEVRRRVLLGTFTLSAGYKDAYYGRAQGVRAAVRAAFLQCLAGVDVVLAPTVPGPAPRLGELTDPVQLYLLDVFTIGPSLAGLPALHVPTGAADGLPVGVQLLGAPFAEETLALAGEILERGGP